MGRSRQPSKPISQINIAKIGPLSQANMMVSLFQSGYDLPKESTQYLKQLVEVEAGYASARNLLKQPNSHFAIIGDIKNSIDQLSNNRSLQEAFRPELESLNNETKENDQLREMLTKKLDKHLMEYRSALTEASEAIGQKDFQKIKPIALKTIKAKNDFAKEVKQLESKEPQLTSKIAALKEKTLSAAPKEARPTLSTPSPTTPKG